MACTITRNGYAEKIVARGCFVSCSDPLSSEASLRWKDTQTFLESLGWEILYPATFEELWNAEPSLVLDPSGGSLANQAIPSLMRSLPGRPRRCAWWSMSDNSVILNALLSRNSCRVFHGQPLTLTGKFAEIQRERFELWSSAVVKGLAFPQLGLPPLRWVRGVFPDVIELVGGNLRAWGKLVGTPWLPQRKNRVLLLESLSLEKNEAVSLVTWLHQAGVTEGLAGVLLGRFTRFEALGLDPATVLLPVLPVDLPVATCSSIGHGSQGWTVPLGEALSFPRQML